MLVIRQQQLRALTDDLRRRWLLNHLATYFPTHFHALPAHERAGFLSGVMNRATALGINSDASLCLYATLALLLGPGLASDPELPWVSAILNDAGAQSADEKIEAVYEEAARRLSGA